MSDSLEGICEPLSDEQQEKVATLRQRIEPVERPASYSRWLEHHPTLFMCKWLYARKWDVDEAFNMYRDAAAWRLAEGFETKPLFPTPVVIRGYDEDALRKIHGTEERATDQFVDKASAHMKSTYAGAWHKWDRDGRPVYIERTGQTRPREIIARARELMPPGESLEPVVVEPHKQSNEVGHVLLQAQNKKLAAEGKFVGQITVIMDCKGMTMGHFYGPAMELLKANSTMDQKYFPEGLYKTYVVNAPTVIKMGWAIVRLWIDKRSQEKVVFVPPNDTQRVLLEAVGEDNLPEFLGGKCRCEGDCVPEVAEHTGDVPGGDVTVELQVGARSSKKHIVVMPQGSEASWSFASSNGNDVGFAVHFRGAEMDDDAGDGPAIVPSSRVKEGSGSFTAPQDGCMTMVFDNTFSWMKGKTIHLRVSGP